MRNSRGAKCALSLSSNPQDGPMGEAGIHSHPAQASDNEASTVSARQAHVSSYFDCTLMQIEILSGKLNSKYHSDF